MTDTTDLAADIEDLAAKLLAARDSVNRRFIGQERVVELVLAAMLSGGMRCWWGCRGWARRCWLIRCQR